MQDAAAYAALGQQIADNIASGKKVMSADQIEQVKAVLDPLHKSNVALSKDLDAALAAAEKN